MNDTVRFTGLNSDGSPRYGEGNPQEISYLPPRRDGAWIFVCRGCDMIKADGDWIELLPDSTAAAGCQSAHVKSHGLDDRFESFIAAFGALPKAQQKEILAYVFGV